MPNPLGLVAKYFTAKAFVAISSTRAFPLAFPTKLREIEFNPHEYPGISDRKLAVIICGTLV
jgi:hypothetical protein